MTKPLNITGFVPRPIPGAFKYNNKGAITADTFMQFNIPHDLAIKMAEDANMALADNTKSNYNTVKNTIVLCEIAMEVDLTFPWDTSKVLNCLAYLLYCRKVSSKTANCQLSGVRMAHLEMLLECHCLQPPIVKMLLKGKEHWDSVSKIISGKPKRGPMTIDLMLVVKRRLFEVLWVPEKKFTFWAAATLQWNGSTRTHEILSKQQNNFDPQQTLLFENVEMLKVRLGGQTREIIKILIKLTKEDRVGCNTVLEIFGNDSFLCPVRAMKNYFASKGTKLRKSLPFFLKSSGQCYTGKDFNDDLKELTVCVTGGTDQFIRSHSLRAGVPSELAKIGATNEEICGTGRWTSEAWKAYCKLNRTKRLNIVDRLFTSLSS